LQYTATHCNTLQHTATHCNTLQHTATHCNTLQHMTMLTRNLGRGTIVQAAPCTAVSNSVTGQYSNVCVMIHEICVPWLKKCVCHDSWNMCAMTQEMCVPWSMKYVCHDSRNVCAMTHEMHFMSNELRMPLSMKYAQMCAMIQQTIRHTATYCNVLQRIAIHCNTLQYTATHCNALHHTATHCNTLQHTAPHCITPHHTVCDDSVSNTVLNSTVGQLQMCATTVKFVPWLMKYVYHERNCVPWPFNLCLKSWNLCTMSAKCAVIQ